MNWKTSKRIAALCLWALALPCLAPAQAQAQGDSQGQELTASCIACHGQTGNSPTGAFPNLAGQTQEYLLKQLLEIQSGARPMPAMAGMLDGFTEAELATMASWYASQERAYGAAKPELAELGEAIYLSGIKRKRIMACTGCHSPTGSGNGPAGFPALAGQWPEYTEMQLRAFRSGERQNDGDGKMMQGVAYDMNDREIAAVAAYLYGLREAE